MWIGPTLIFIQINIYKIILLGQRRFYLCRKLPKMSSKVTKNHQKCHQMSQSYDHQKSSKTFQLNMVIFHEIWWYLVTFDDIWWFFKTKPSRLSWYVMKYHELSMTCHRPVDQPIERGCNNIPYIRPLIKANSIQPSHLLNRISY